MLMRFIATLLILPLLFAVAEAKPAKSKSVDLDIPNAKEVEYKKIEAGVLRMWIFSPKDHTASDKRPAAVFFFGGGWNGGTPTQFQPHAEYLASRGMVAAIADYRVKSRQGTSPFECVADGKSAVRWLRTNAATLGIDPDRIAAGGGSAGGHVAAAVGNCPGLEQSGEDTSVSSKPNALLLFNPVYDNGPDGYGHSRVKDRWEEISPMHNIRKGAPPTITFLGSKDSLIPVATGELYDKKMKEAGSKSELHVYEGQPHGFFNKSKAGGVYYVKTVTAMDKFLVFLGWLEGEPTVKAE